MGIASRQAAELRSYLVLSDLLWMLGLQHLSGRVVVVRILNVLALGIQTSSDPHAAAAFSKAMHSFRQERHA